MIKSKNFTVTVYRGFGAALLTLCLSFLLLELGGWIIWYVAVPAHDKASIQSLCRAGHVQPEKIPATFWHHQLNPKHPKYRGQINAKGTKGPNFTLPKPRDELRIICLGDSTVEGTGVNPGETFPSLLETLLSRQIQESPGHPAVTVINAGIGSHNSAFNLAYLAFRLIHFDPDVVVIKSSYNDYLPYCIPGMTYDYTHAFPNPFHRVQRSAFWSLARRSNFLKIVGIIALPDEVAVPFRDFSGHMTRKQFWDMDYSSNDDKFFVYAENVRSMLLLCKGRGIDVILVDLPTSPNPLHFGRGRALGPRFKSLVHRLETEVKRIAREEAVTFVRTGPFSEGDFWDRCHCTPSGNLKIAEAVASAVINSQHRDNPGSTRTPEKDNPPDSENPQP